MTNASHPTSDREALSALFDGELAGDAARFALKRLDHDQDWRATCERWQLAGDALRGQTHALLSPAFPSAVRAAMRAGAAPPVATRSAAPSHARRWGGVALAASAAVVALFLARMPVGGDVAAPQVVTANAAAASPVAPVAPPQPAPDAGVGELAVASVVAATTTTRVAQRERTPQRTRRAASPQRAVAAASPVVGEAIAADTAVADATTAMGSASLAPSAPATPFDANAARPWPRAVLPQYGNGGALAADYAAPSFYPFAPRVPDAAATQATDAPADDRAPPAPPAP